MKNSRTGLRRIEKALILNHFKDYPILKEELIAYNYFNYIMIKMYTGKQLSKATRFSPSSKAIRTSLTDYKEEQWMINIHLYAIGKENL
jgi:hypothetical protein